MSALLAPLQYDFMIKALISAAAVGGVCALLSVYLMLKGWSLIGDALSHAVVPGVALAYLWKLPYALGAFTTGILAAAAAGWLTPVASSVLHNGSTIAILLNALRGGLASQPENGPNAQSAKNTRRPRKPKAA